MPSPATPGNPQGVPSPSMAMGGGPQVIPNQPQMANQPQMPNQAQMPNQSQIQNMLSSNILTEQLGAGIGPSSGPLAGLGGPQSQMTPQQQQVAAAAGKERRKVVWGGVVEYQEKSPQLPGQPAAPLAQRVTFELPCQISCSVVNGEPEVNAEKWPPKLVLELLPRNLIMKLFQILKTGSIHVGLHFSATPDSDGLVKLSKSMSATYVGCVQFPQTQAPTMPRMMIVIYMPDKRLFMGFIPNDQDGFFTAMKQMIEQHKKEQANKQKMVSLRCAHSSSSYSVAL